MTATACLRKAIIIRNGLTTPNRDASPRTQDPRARCCCHESTDNTILGTLYGTRDIPSSLPQSDPFVSHRREGRGQESRPPRLQKLSPLAQKMTNFFVHFLNHFLIHFLRSACANFQIFAPRGSKNSIPRSWKCTQFLAHFLNPKLSSEN